MEDQDTKEAKETDWWDIAGKVAIAIVLGYVLLHIFGFLLFMIAIMSFGP